MKFFQSFCIILSQNATENEELPQRLLTPMIPPTAPDKSIAKNFTSVYVLNFCFHTSRAMISRITNSNAPQRMPKKKPFSRLIREQRKPAAMDPRLPMISPAGENTDSGRGKLLSAAANSSISTNMVTIPPAVAKHTQNKAPSLPFIVLFSFDSIEPRFFAIRPPHISDVSVYAQVFSDMQKGPRRSLFFTLL